MACAEFEKRVRILVFTRKINRLFTKMQPQLQPRWAPVSLTAASALSLLVARILADHAHNAVATDNLAVPATLLD